ncbi:MAG: hypothetical protein WC007_11350 [Pelobacteraceae bacterium]
MQPVNESTLQQRIIPAQQRISGFGETSPSAVKKFPTGKTVSLPEDIVNLSTDRLTNLASDNKKPSVPVTPVEKKALRESFSVYA